MSEEVRHWSIQNNIDMSACIIQKMEEIAWHGLRNTNHRTKAQMKNDFDQMLVQISELKKCLGVWT